MRIIDADSLTKFLAIRLHINERIRFAYRLINSTPTIKTKSVKYYDEDERVWKIGEVIVNE